jgi:hypothetical protein
MEAPMPKTLEEWVWWVVSVIMLAFLVSVVASLVQYNGHPGMNLPDQLICLRGKDGITVDVFPLLWCFSFKKALLLDQAISYT